MKNFAKFLYATVLLCLGFLFLSCGDDDKKPVNQIVINGVSYKFQKCYIKSQLRIRDRFDRTGSAHYILLAGEGIELNDDQQIIGEGDYVLLTIGSRDILKLMSGTYELKPSVYQIGNAIEFEVYDNYRIQTDRNGNLYEAYDGQFMGLTGSIKVSNSGNNKYTFTIAVDSYSVGDSENGEPGKGNITGYFS